MAPGSEKLLGLPPVISDSSPVKQEHDAKIPDFLLLLTSSGSMSIADLSSTDSINEHERQ